MIKLRGHIEVDNGVRIKTNWDLCRYYQWHINKYFYNTIKTQLPRHGGHSTLINPNIHKITDFSPVKHLHGQVAEFIIFPEKLYQSRVNFWIPAEIPIEKEIKQLLNVKDNSNYWGAHFTICNVKFNS